MTAAKEIRPSEQQIVNLLPSISTTDILGCDMCSRSFQNRSAKRFHMSKTHGMNVNDWRGLDQQMGVDAAQKCLPLKFVCPREMCLEKKSFSSAKLLLQHFQKSHLEKRLSCSQCQAKFSLMRDLNYHSKKKCPANKVHLTASSSKKTTPQRKNKRKSVETQTDVVENDIKRFLIIPITKYRKILPKPLPTCTTSTQVENTECAEEWLSDYSQHNNYDTASSSNFVDIGLQADFSCFEEFPASHSDTTNYCYMANTSQQQDSFSQTSYPKTVDFGTQYVNCNRGFLDLPPLKSTRSTANALVGTDGTANISFVPPISCNSTSTSHYLDSNYWRHIETQTSGGLWEQEKAYCHQAMFQEDYRQSRDFS